MTTYPQIKGLRVKYLSDDPANAEDGQVWYNSTTGNLRVANVIGAGAWSSGASTNTATRDQAGFGTQTANIIVGGYTGSFTNRTESYDGSSWTTLPATYPQTQSGLNGCGTQTSGLTFGGDLANDALTASWDGSTWTAVNSMNTGRETVAGFGTQTSAVAAGGSYPSTSLVEEWDGTNWTAVTALPSVRRLVTGAGVLTAGLVFGGINDPTTIDLTEEYNGTSWSPGGNLLTPLQGSASSGTQTSALQMGGGTPTASPIATGASSQYNGTSWSATATMAQGRSSGSGSPSGTGTTALQTNGSIQTGPTSHPAATEEFTAPVGTANITST